jgi:hypothetical protein
MDNKHLHMLRRTTQLLFVLLIILATVFDILRIDSYAGSLIVLGQEWSIGLREGFNLNPALENSSHVAWRFFLKALLPCARENLEKEEESSVLHSPGTADCRQKTPSGSLETLCRISTNLSAANVVKKACDYRELRNKFRQAVIPRPDRGIQSPYERRQERTGFSGQAGE